MSDHGSARASGALAILELRTYRTVPGGAEALADLMRTAAVPLLLRHGIDVVACGVSRDPRDGDPPDVYLFRAFPDEATRAAQEAAFYGSSAWRGGPQEAVLGLIESFHTVVLELPASAIVALRH